MQDIDGRIDFFLYEKGENITINGAEQTALVIDVVDKLTYYDDNLSGASVKSKRVIS